MKVSLSWDARQDSWFSYSSSRDRGSEAVASCIAWLGNEYARESGLVRVQWEAHGIFHPLVIERDMAPVVRDEQHLRREYCCGL